MCYNYSLNKSPLEISAHYDRPYAQGDEHIRLYINNGFSFNKSPIITQNSSEEISTFEWGYLRFWNEDPETNKYWRGRMLNARSDKVFETPTFKKAIYERRCLIPITGIVEYRFVKKKFFNDPNIKLNSKKNGAKIPYLVKTDQEIQSVAGLYNIVLDKSTGELLHTFSMLTTEANPYMRMIHNEGKNKFRMPCYLSSTEENDWLDPNLTQTQISDLMRPYNNEVFHSITLNQAVNNSRINKNLEENLEYVEYDIPDLQTQTG